MCKNMEKTNIKKAVLITKPVAWSGDAPTKYQSMLEYYVNEKRAIRILGDPKATKDAALDDLSKEFLLWEEAMLAFKNVVYQNLNL